MLGEDEWLYFKARVQYPDVSTLAFAIDVTSGAADLFVRGGNAQPTLAEHQRSELAIAVGASATISLQPAGDASPCSIAECVVHCGVRGALPGWSSFVLRVSLAVERRGVHIDLPPSIAGSLPYQMASFGAPMPFGQGLSVPLALAEPEELCLPAGQPGAAFAGGHAPSLAGAVALVRRGGCLFVDKVAAAALAGAVGVLVVNNNATVPEQLLIMDVPSSMDAAQQELIGRVPAAMVAFGDGERLLAALRAGNESAVTLAHADERAPVPLPSDSTAVAHSTADRQASVFALRGLRGEATSLGGAQQYRIVASFASAAVGSVPELLLLAGSANASAEAAPSLTRFAAQGERTASGSVLTLRRDLHPSLFQTDAPPPLLAVFANHGGGFALPVTLACTASREIELLPASTFSGTSAAGGDLLAFSLPLDTHLYGRAAIELQLTVDSERDMTAALYAAVGTVAPDASTAAWSAEDNRLKRSRRLVLRASVELAGSERPSRLHFSLRTVETQLSFTLSVSVLYPQPPASSGPAPSPSPAPAPSPGGASPSPAASPSAAGSAAAAGGSDGELPLCEYRVVPMAYTDEPLLANVLSQGVRLPDDRLAFAHDMLVVLLVSACLLMLAERSSRQAAQTAPLRTPRQCWCAPAPPCPRAVPPPPRCLRGGPSWARLATPSLRSPRARAAPQPHPPLPDSACGALCPGRRASAAHVLVVLAPLLLLSGIFYLLLHTSQVRGVRVAATVLDVSCVALALVFLAVLAARDLGSCACQLQRSRSRTRDPFIGLAVGGGIGAAWPPPPSGATADGAPASMPRAAPAIESAAGCSAYASHEPSAPPAPSAGAAAAGEAASALAGLGAQPGTPAPARPSLSDYELFGFASARLLSAGELATAYAHATAAETVARGAGSSRHAELSAAHARLLAHACQRHSGAADPPPQQPNATAAAVGGSPAQLSRAAAGTGRRRDPAAGGSRDPSTVPRPAAVEASPAGGASAYPAEFELVPLATRTR